MKTPITDSAISRIEKAHTKSGANVTTKYKAAYADLGNEMRKLEKKLKVTVLQPIATAPKDGRYILLAGPSGYINTPLRFEAGRYEERTGAFKRCPWNNHGGEPFTDGGEPPTHWMDLPEAAE